MKGCIQSKLFLVAAVTLFMLMALPAFAAGNCSPYLGQASINELFKDRTNQANDPDDFVEIKIIDPALSFATFSQWTIQLCERNDAGNNQDNDGCSAKISLAGFFDSTPPWIVLKDGSIGSFFNFKTGFDAILLDANDDVVDYVSVDGYALQEQSGCTGTALAFPYQASAPGSSVKFILRSPDGTGPWGGPKSASALPTEGASNDGTSLPALDHYAISHAGTGVTCESESVSIIAHDSLHNAVAPSSSTTITLSTSVANDGWALKTGNGIFAPPNQYTFDGSETAVEFWLTKLTAAIIDIDVSDGTATDLDGNLTEDINIEFKDTGFRFYADGVHNDTGTQIAGKASNIAPGAQILTLGAVQTNSDTGACEAVLAGPVTIQIAYECKDPAVCSSRPLYIGGATASSPLTGTDDTSPLNFQNVTLDFGTVAAPAPAQFVVNFPDSGQIQLHAQHTVSASLPGTGVSLNGSSNPFVWRPFGFDVDVVANPAGVGAGGTVFTTAGTPFQINISAELWDGTDAGADGIPDNHDNNDPSDNDSLQNNTITLGGIDYSGVPSFGQEGEAVTLSAILIEPFISAYPDVDFPTQTISSFTPGTTSASFNDVGVIEIRAAIADGDYLDVGAAETAEMISKSGYVGRFIPAFFQITPENGMLLNSCVPLAGTPFTYIGQTFGYDIIRPGFLLSAMNALPTPAITQNYTGPWAKLNDASVALTAPTSDATQTGSDTATLMAVTYTPDTSLYNITDNADGTLTFEFGDDEFVYDKDGNSEISEFLSDIDLTITSVVDLDGVSTTAAFTLTPDPVRLRFGRIRMSNVHGSELIGLQMPMIVEYFTGGFYQANIDDSCTDFDNADIIVVADNLSIPGSSTITVTNATAVAGDLGISLTAPGAGITGQIDLSALLDGGVVDNQWLQYDWDGDGLFDNDPAASATFGIFSGNDVNIYIQQIFR